MLLAACGPAREIHSDRVSAQELPLPAEEPVFHFVIYGDRTGGPVEGIEVLAQAVGETNLLDPDLVMTVGDLVQGYNATAQWLRQMREYRDTMAALEMPWYPVAGNHDIYWRPQIDAPPEEHEGNYETNFGPLWYWFPHKNAAFIVLYSDEANAESGQRGWGAEGLQRMSARQLAWLEGALRETADFDHVFVFLHHPRWILPAYKHGNWEAVHQRLAAAGNVSAVFAGHIHRERFDGRREGIAYHTLATTGGRLVMEVPGSGWLHHMQMVTVRPSGFEVASIPIGAVTDPEDMTPEHLAAVDRARNLPIALSGSALVLAAGRAAAGSARFTLENITGRPLAVTVQGDSLGGDWLFQPPHQHRWVAPDDTVHFDLSLRRPPDPLGALSLPSVSLQIDLIGEAQRVALPAHLRLLPISAGQVPDPGAAVQNRALQLHGQESALYLAPQTPPLLAPDDPLTLEAWFKSDPELAVAGQLQALVAKGRESEFGLYLRDGRPLFFLGLEEETWIAGLEAVPGATPGRWHHVAGVYDGAEMRLYLDGSLLDRGPVSGPRKTNGRPLYVGAAPNEDGLPGHFFGGLIDELRISRAARYAGESFHPAYRHAPDAATTLLLDFDNGSRRLAPDRGPERRHLLALPSQTLTESDR